MSDISQNLFAAIDTIVDKKIASATYDSTIQATIIDISNRSKGRYTVQYQDAVFEAFATGGTKYNLRDNVYVLIPTNRFENNKYIIGGVNGIGKLPSGDSESNTTVDINDIVDEVIMRLPVYKGTYTLEES